jgi:hypothetical protein
MVKAVPRSGNSGLRIKYILGGDAQPSGDRAGAGRTRPKTDSRAPIQRQQIGHKTKSSVVDSRISKTARLYCADSDSLISLVLQPHKSFVVGWRFFEGNSSVLFLVALSV